MSTSTVITEKLIINGNNKDIVLNGLDFTKNGYLEIRDARSIEVKNCRVYNMNLPDKKNYWLKIEASESAKPIILKVHHNFFGSNPKQGSNTMFNLIEPHALLKSGSTISENWFAADCCSHISITLYGIYDNAVVDVNKNHFMNSDIGIRIGCMNTPKGIININDTEAELIVTPDAIANLVLVEPYATSTTTFENLTINMNVYPIVEKDTYRRMSFEECAVYPMAGGAGQEDTPISRESMPRVNFCGKSAYFGFAHNDENDNSIGPMFHSATNKHVAVINTTGYTTWNKAKKAATENDEITIFKDVTDSEVGNYKIIKAAKSINISEGETEASE